jgi:phage-related protein
MREKLIAYRGKKFTLEWYFDDKEKSEVLEYFENLTRDRQKKLIHLFLLLGDSGKIFNKEKFRSEGDQLYAFKTSDDRFLCFFFDGAKVIITNAYEKKSKKMPPREKQRALKAKSDYIKRCKDGDYYD